MSHLRELIAQVRSKDAQMGADLEDARRISARIGSGEEEALPADFVALLLARKAHPVHLWRKFRSMTLAGLGDVCGVTRLALSQIEGGKTRASAALLRKLADALGCDMDDLVSK